MKEQKIEKQIEHSKVTQSDHSVRSKYKLQDVTTKLA